MNHPTQLITQSTRAALLSDILGHPEELPSVREFEYLNPDVKRSNIEYHLQQLVDAGIIERVSLPKGQRKRDPPSTFYGLTDNGYEFLEAHGLLEEQPVWKAVNQRVEKPPEIRQAEGMDRPSRS
jgi:DNA-binding HxlR family transcriptional regulator